MWSCGTGPGPKYSWESNMLYKPKSHFISLLCAPFLACKRKHQQIISLGAFTPNTFCSSNKSNAACSTHVHFERRCLTVRSHQTRFERRASLFYSQSLCVGASIELQMLNTQNAHNAPNTSSLAPLDAQNTPLWALDASPTVNAPWMRNAFGVSAPKVCLKHGEFQYFMIYFLETVSSAYLSMQIQLSSRNAA